MFPKFRVCERWNLGIPFFVMKTVLHVSLLVATFNNIVLLVRCTPTVIPAKNFDANKDATAIDEALKNGVNEGVLQSILTARSCMQRMEISRAYAQLFKKFVIEPIGDRTKGTYEQLLKDSFVCDDMLTAVHLGRALNSRDGKRVKGITEILVTNTESAEKQTAVANMYKKVCKSLLEDDIGKQLDGDYKNVALEMAKRRRQPKGPTDEKKAYDIANQLHDGRKKWENDRALLDETLLETHFEQLNLIFQKFRDISGRELEEVIKEKLKGDKRTAYRNLIHFCKDYTNKFIGYMATRLFETVDGAGTDEQSMIRIILLHSETDLKEIQDQFSKLYENRKLADKLGSDISGSFEALLLGYITGNNK